MKYLYKYLIIFLCLISAWRVSSQGSISGKVIDYANGLSIKSASIVVTDENKKQYGVTITDSAGAFSIEKLPFGYYRIRTTFVGFNNHVRDSILVSALKPAVTIRPIKLKPDTTTFKDVVVNAAKEDFVNEIDKKVYRMGSNLASDGGSVLDAMRNLPSVNVSINGKISLRGSRNVTVLIDGKQSAITGSSRQAILDNLQASSVESIEVITNPGSEYDADGSSGIINIITKKGGNLGVNGSIALTGGTWNKAGANGYLAYNTSKISFFANYSYRLNNLFNSGSSDKYVYVSTPNFYLLQNRSGNNSQGTHMGRIGLTYNFSNKSNISFTGTGRYQDQTLTNNFDQRKLHDDRSIDSISQRTGLSKNKEFSYEFDLSYEKKFKKSKHKLTAEASYSVNSAKQNTGLSTLYEDSNQVPYSRDPKLRSITGYPAFSIIMGRIDYHLPLPKKLFFTCGLKASIRSIDNDYRAEDYSYTSHIWANNNSLTNHFKYGENVFAGYFNLSHNVGQFSYKIGLRLEYAMITAQQITLNKKFTSNYFSPYPTLHLKYQIREKSDIALSYSRRVNRPDVSSLDPFPNIVNPYVITAGNPYLKPEYINAVELSYSFKNPKHSVTASVYYRYHSAVIGRYNTLGDGGVSYITFQNLSESHSGGLEIVARNQLFSWWKLLSSANLFYYKINASNLQADLSSNSIGGLIKVMSSFNFFKTLDIQLTGNCNLPQASAQTTTKPYGSMDIALRNSFWNNKIILTLTVSDIFNTNVQNTYTQGTGFRTTANRKYETRIAQLTVTYKFGKTKAAKEESKMEDYTREMLEEGDLN